MRVTIQWRSFGGPAGRGFLRRAGYLLLAAGCAALGFCAWVYFQAGFFQAYEDRRLEDALHAWNPAGRTGPEAGRASLLRVAAQGGAPFARIEIPRVAISAMVVEGAGHRTLKLAVGHIPGTAFPDESGNVGLAGHRDTFFRGLREIRKDDVITLTTVKGIYRYSVEWTRVTGPHDVGWLEAADGQVLTLVTCYPFYYVGPAPQRFIVRARAW